MGVILGAVDMAQAFVLGAGSLGQIRIDRPGRLVSAEARGVESGAAACATEVPTATASSQQIGHDRERSTARLKVTCLCPTAAN